MMNDNPAGRWGQWIPDLETRNRQILKVSDRNVLLEIRSESGRVVP